MMKKLRCIGLVLRVMPIVLVLSGCCTYSRPGKKLNNPNSYCGSDSEKIEKALVYAAKNQLPLEITARCAPDGRSYWLLDRAILLPGNMELQIVDCKIKLSDRSRDNFIRSANCIAGLDRIAKVQNIKIRGIGKAVLEGADHPRATGDSGKKLGVKTYGTDAGKAGEVQIGNWRNIGILLADVDDFEISNLTIIDSHCWAISLEYCRRGKVKDIQFYSSGSTEIDGKPELTLNQDGLDLRRGCQYIDIENITGWAGDDLIALTAIGTDIKGRSGSEKSSMFSAPERRGADDDTHHINIRNVYGFSAGNCNIIRLLNNRGVKIHHVTIENLNDRSPSALQNRAAVRIGDRNYGGYAAIGDTHNITIRNIHSNADAAIFIQGTLADSVIEDVKLRRHWATVFSIAEGMKALRNVKLPANLIDQATRLKTSTPEPKRYDDSNWVQLYYPEPPHIREVILKKYSKSAK